MLDHPLVVPGTVRMLWTEETPHASLGPMVKTNHVLVVQCDYNINVKYVHSPQLIYFSVLDTTAEVWHSTPVKTVGDLSML